LPAELFPEPLIIFLKHFLRRWSRRLVFSQRQQQAKNAEKRIAQGLLDTRSGRGERQLISGAGVSNCLTSRRTPGSWAKGQVQ
jgi:hypothetical protein